MATLPSADRQTNAAAAKLASLQLSERQWAYALLRLILGVDLFCHGLIRVLHGTSAFAEGMVTQMSFVPLPAPFVHVLGLAIPWIELSLGALIILGIFSRIILTASMFFMIALMIGVTLKQDWPTAGLQLMYGFVIFALLFLREGYGASWLVLLGLRSAP